MPRRDRFFRRGDDLNGHPFEEGVDSSPLVSGRSPSLPSRLPSPPRFMRIERPLKPELHDGYPPLSNPVSACDEHGQSFYYSPLHPSPTIHPPSPLPSPPLSYNKLAGDHLTLDPFPQLPHHRPSSPSTCPFEITRSSVKPLHWIEPSFRMLPIDRVGERELESRGLVDLSASDASGPEKHASHLNAVPHSHRDRRRKVVLCSVALALVAVVIIIATVVSSRKIKPAQSDSAAQADGTLVNSSGDLVKLWGANGDKITTDNGTSFEYKNPLGGTWVAIPFNDTAKCQGDSPPLNQPWDYSHRRILGVNLGGWLVLEPFITPYLFEPFNSNASAAAPTVVDEWSLSIALGDKLSSTLEQHYRTFITEEDFMEIAAAGLNWVRLPVGWWMIETWDGEPFLKGVSFKYFLQALTWARKYGLRVNLDLHAVPGSQNGYNHSGRLGSINFLVGLMGVANAQRTLNYIRTLTEFISQPEYVNVVPMFSVLNEALVPKIGSNQIRAFYLQVYQMMRGITGYGMGKGPMMVIHDGFQGTGAGHLGWGGYLKGADRLGLDTHNYFAFDKQSNDSMEYNAYKPCTYWAKSFNQTNTDFGFNLAGEYSLAINDCGLWLNNVGAGSRYDGTYPNATAPDSKNFPRMGSCDSWSDYRTWSPDMKSHLADLAAASQDAMQNSFFWTWKISQSIRTPAVKPNPMWDYQLGLKSGWIRPDARTSVGACGLLAGRQGTSPPVQPWSGQFTDWQVGANTDSSPTIEPEQLKLYGQWPPNQIYTDPGGSAVYPDVKNLPQYEPTGSVVVLKPTSPDSRDFPANSIVEPGDGWANDSDRAGWYVPTKGCQYPNPWAAGGLSAPSGPYCHTSTP